MRKSQPGRMQEFSASPSLNYWFMWRSGLLPPAQVCAAVSQNGLALELFARTWIEEPRASGGLGGWGQPSRFASDALRADRDTVKRALHQDGQAGAFGGAFLGLQGRLWPLRAISWRRCNMWRRFSASWRILHGSCQVLAMLSSLDAAVRKRS